MMKVFGKIATAMLVTLAIGLTSPDEAFAGYTVFTTATSYNAASFGNTRVTFDGLVPDGKTFQPEPVPPGLTKGGVNFTINQATSNGQLFAINGLGPRYGTSPVLSSQASTSGVNNLVVTLPGSYTAIAIDLNSFINTNGSFSQDPLTITLSTGAVFNITPPTDGTYGFFGLTSTTSFASLTIADSSTSGSGVLNLADFTFGNAVPEPSSLALVAIGLGGPLGLAWRRRRMASGR